MAMTTPITLDQLIERLNDVRVFAGGYDASHEATIVMAVAALEKSRRPIELIGRVEIEKRNLADEVERLTAERARVCAALGISETDDPVEAIDSIKEIARDALQAEAEQAVESARVQSGLAEDLAAERDRLGQERDALQAEVALEEARDELRLAGDRIRDLERQVAVAASAIDGLREENVGMTAGCQALRSRAAYFRSALEGALDRVAERLVYLTAPEPIGADNVWTLMRDANPWRDLYLAKLDEEADRAAAAAREECEGGPF